uniref:Uncharacterized protein n=1 Tax=Arundo donax TaxID=35708 RepID=A0A0A8ZHD3_ARUDO
MPTPLVSHSGSKVLLKSGSTKTGVCESFSLISLKFDLTVSFH